MVDADQCLCRAVPEPCPRCRRVAPADEPRGLRERRVRPPSAGAGSPTATTADVLALPKPSTTIAFVFDSPESVSVKLSPGLSSAPNVDPLRVTDIELSPYDDWLTTADHPRPEELVLAAWPREKLRTPSPLVAFNPGVRAGGFHLLGQCRLPRPAGWAGDAHSPE
jgi:hypothetical protein